MTRIELLKKYRGFGWVLLPVKKGEKRPAIATWTEYQKRRPTKEELNEWFKDPEVGVGVVTGKLSGIVVIDEDSYKDGGTKLDLKTPLRTITGSGGRHLFFKYTEGLGNKVDKERAIDIRGEGGFIVLPPTKHPNGKFYQWDGKAPETIDNLPALDESFAEQFTNAEGHTDALKMSDYLKISSGSRNDSLHRVACSLLNKHNEEEAFQLLTAVNNSYDPPLPQREMETVFKSASAFVESSPKEKAKKDKDSSDREELEIITFKEAEDEYARLMKRFGDGLTTGYGMLDEYFKFVPTQLYMLSAPTHQGKTTIALNIAGRVARAGHKVVFASLEQNVFIIPRLKSMFGSARGLENISIIAPDSMPNTEDFIKLFQKIKLPELLIIDHLHYFERTGRGATEDMDSLIANLQLAAKKLELPILVICHLRKLNSDKPPTLDDLKDSSSLSQIPGVVMLLHRKYREKEDSTGGAGVLEPYGKLYINKNRVHGRTGVEDFEMHDNGEVVFRKYVMDRVNKSSEKIHKLDNAVDGFFEDV